MRGTLAVLALLISAAAGPASAAADPVFCRAFADYLAAVRRLREANTFAVRYDPETVACTIDKRLRRPAKALCAAIVRWGPEMPSLFPLAVKDCLEAEGVAVRLEASAGQGGGDRIDRLQAEAPGFGKVDMRFDPLEEGSYGGAFGWNRAILTPASAWRPSAQ